MKLNFLKPRLLLKIKGDAIDKIINIFKGEEIFIDEIDCVEDYINCKAYLIDYEKIKLIAENNNCSVEMVKEVGVYFRLIKCKNIYSYLAGILCFGVILYIVSLFLWNIEYEGNLTITDAQLEEYLKEKNISTGIFLSDIDCNTLEENIRSDFFDVTWVCAEIRGTNLILHIKENYTKGISVEEKLPYNLVAKHNSIIKSIITRQGVPMVKSGDIVKEGDLLISGTVDVYNEYDEKLFSDYVNADGDIYGETTFFYQDSFSMSYTDKLVYDEYKIIPYIQIFDNTIGLNPADGENYYMIDEYKNLKLFENFYIPVKIGVKKQFFYEKIDKKYTKEEAISVANNKLLLFLQSLEEKEMQILEKDVNIYVGQNLCKSEGYITVQEQLAKVSPINYQEEEATTVNERN